MLSLQKDFCTRDDHDQFRHRYLSTLTEKAELRGAYYKRAKLLHPDIAGEAKGK